MADGEDLKKTHHEQAKFSYNRPKYREARWERAVKVYTINLESKYLLVQGVPSVGATKELLELFALYGAVEEYRILDDYPAEPFTQVYWIKFQKINAARVAKRKLDNKSFFGGVLHVCYAPEYEKIDDTREKLQERRKVIARKTREYYGAQRQDIPTENTSKAAETSDANQQPLEQLHNLHQQNLASVLPQSEDKLESATLASQSADACAEYPQGFAFGKCGYYDYPPLPHPPVPLPPMYLPSPPPPPSWDLPRVPTAHATLPQHLQNLPPPPPPPPLPPATCTAPPLPPVASMPSPLSAPTSTALPTSGPALRHPPPGRAGRGSSNVLHREPHINTSSIPLPQSSNKVPGRAATLPSVTGDTSMDMTVLAVRNKMKVITGPQTDTSDKPGEQTAKRAEQSPATPATKKKRKRI